MQYTKLGRTGLDVSRLCLGCMSYGGGNSGFHQWSLGEEESRPFIKKALEAGINFFDTANRYSVGKSEEVLGRALHDFARREEVVIATKVFNRMRPGPNGAGLSRKNILFEIDESLRRLGTDYVDLYQIHRFDHETPIEETMEALHDVVKAGKARYIGASSMAAWEFGKALAVAERHGWTRFVSMQNLVNLMYREEEREMLPLCADQGIGVIPWSPLAGGLLGGVLEKAKEGRRASPDIEKRVEKLRPQLEAYESFCKELGEKPADIALAWLLKNPIVTAPIIGPRTNEQFNGSLRALEIKLDAEQLKRLDEIWPGPGGEAPWAYAW